VFHSLLDLIVIVGTAGPLNDGHPRKWRGDHASILGVVPADIRSRSIYLSKHFPDARLSGKSHEIILMDDRDHAGILMACVVERP
jgi:hypothetical protein